MTERVAVWMAVVVLVAGVCVGGVSVTPIACGFEWAENAAFHAAECALWVSDARLGQVRRIWYNESASAYQQAHVQWTGAENPSGFLGLAYDAASGDMYAVAKGGTVSGGNSSSIVRFAWGWNGTQPLEAVATLPDMANGLVRTIGGSWYTASEGSFVPRMGRLWAVSLERGVVAVDSSGFALDGVGLWDHPRGTLVVVSDVLLAHLLVFNGSASAVPLLGTVKVKGPRSVDDFLLQPSGAVATAMVADYVGGGVFQTGSFGAMDGTVEAVAVVASLPHATSVRRGFAPTCAGFGDASAVFVTQGGTLWGGAQDKCVYRVVRD